MNRRVSTITALLLALVVVTAVPAQAAKNLGNPATPTFVFTGCDVQFKTTALTVATTATAIPTTALSQRQSILVQNNDSASIFLGGTSAVAASGASIGLTVAAGASVALGLGPDATLFGISSAGTAANSVVAAECA